MTTHCTHVEFTCHFTPPSHATTSDGERDSLPDNVIIPRGQLCHNKRISFLSLSTAPGLVSKQHCGNFQELYKTLPPFQPIIPVSLLPYLAFTLLTLTFGLAFYFSTSVLPCILQFPTSPSLQFTERDVQRINSRNPRKHTWRFRNSGNVLHCRSIRVKIPICFRTRSLLCNINNRSLRNDRL